ncbi:AAA family ATPase [Candidatus Pyrohabitans sp.]
MRKGKVFAVISAKGGVGKSIVALNLALSLMLDFKKKVLAIDAHAISPNLSLYLGIIDVIPPGINYALKDPSFARESVYIHSATGLHMLAGSITSIKEVDLGNLSRVVEKLRGDYEYIIIDTAPSLGENLRNILKACDEVLLVVNPWLPIVISNLKAVKLAEELGKPLQVVLNKVGRSRDEMRTREVEDSLGHRVIITIPVDLEVYRGVEERKPVVLSNPKSPGSMTIKKLARLIVRNEL